jgi:6-pyruvoyltetrahydropterin/6-carboxytetrahydropterin synthase
VTSPANGFAVSVHNGQLHFNAAHFITCDNSCENLHGHNFHARIDATGDNTGDDFVIDFVLMTRLAAEICARLHDKVLLPGNSRLVNIEHRSEQVHISSYDKQFTLPKGNCLELPVRNTTAEMLAWYICDQLLNSLREHEALGNITMLEVAVEEADQQWGISRQAISHAG